MNTNVPIIELTGVCKAYANDFNLQVDELRIGTGEFVTVLGASGCGKSTLLRLIAGITTPDAGTIHIAGTDMTMVPAERRPINMVFQSYALFPHLNVYDNISFGLRANKVAFAATKQRCAEALELVKLSDFAKRLPQELSGGQQQRVALARALVLQPQALLLDEPLAALDAQLREQMRDYLASLQEETGITFLFVTHDQAEALAVSKRVILLDAGTIVQDGAPQQLYRRPTSLLAARALGRLTTAPAVSNGNGMLHCAALGDIPTPSKKLNGTKVTVALRPERLRLRPGPAPNSKQVTLQVTRQEFYGNVYLVNAQTPDGTTLTAQMDAPLAAEQHECHASWQAADLLIYDSEGNLIGN